MSESRNVWFWSNGGAGIEKAVREWFLPSNARLMPKSQRAVDGALRACNLRFLFSKPCLYVAGTF